MKMKLILLTFVLSVFNVMAQSKKEIISTLNIRIDSLNTEIKKRAVKYEQEVILNIAYNETLKSKIRKQESDLQSAKIALDSSQKINEQLNENVSRLNNEVLTLNDSYSILNNKFLILTADFGTDSMSIPAPPMANGVINNQFLKLKQSVENLCKNEIAKINIIAHISNIYKEHIKLSDSLSLIDNGYYEDLSMEIGYSNDYFICYKVAKESFCCGLFHPIQHDEQYIFDLQSGILHDLTSLILPKKKDELLLLLNEGLKGIIDDLGCLEEFDITNELDITDEFTQENLQSIEIQNEGISLEYRLELDIFNNCSKKVKILKEDIALFFVEKLFK